MDVDGSGLLSQADFVSPYFNLLDINHDGYVSREEYEVGFVKFDADKDGKIEAFEFLGALAGYEIYHGNPSQGTLLQSMHFEVGY